VKILLIFALIIITLVTVFSVQNAIPVVISFLFWKFEASLAIILFLSVLAFVVIGVSAASLFRMKLSKKKSKILLTGKMRAFFKC
jgi:uncharacterized integral membrane protein